MNFSNTAVSCCAAGEVEGRLLESAVGSGVLEAQRREISVLVVHALRFFPRAGLPRNPLGQPGLLLGTGLEDIKTREKGEPAAGRAGVASDLSDS